MVRFAVVWRRFLLFGREKDESGVFLSFFRKSRPLYPPRAGAVASPPLSRRCLLPLDASIDRGDRDDGQRHERENGAQRETARADDDDGGLFSLSIFLQRLFPSSSLSPPLSPSSLPPWKQILAKKKTPDLEWKLTYVGSAESEKYDQVLDSVLVGPVFPGQYRFVFQVRIKRERDPKRERFFFFSSSSFFLSLALKKNPPFQKKTPKKLRPTPRTRPSSPPTTSSASPCSS